MKKTFFKPEIFLIESALTLLFFVAFNFTAYTQELAPKTLEEAKEELNKVRAELHFLKSAFDRPKPSGKYISPIETPSPGYALDSPQLIPACRDLFEQTMLKHNIAGRGVKRGVRWFPKYLQLTQWETFGGVGFSHWIDSITRTVISSDTLIFRIELAIYTEDFLKYNLPKFYEDYDRKKVTKDKLGRITEILVAYRKKAGTPSKYFLNSEDLIGGFDLGEIYP
jgi:hypothetical protein